MIEWMSSKVNDIQRQHCQQTEENCVFAKTKSYALSPFLKLKLRRKKEKIKEEKERVNENESEVNLVEKKIESQIFNTDWFEN